MLGSVVRALAGAGAGASFCIAAVKDDAVHAGRQTTSDDEETDNNQGPLFTAEKKTAHPDHTLLQETRRLAPEK